MAQKRINKIYLLTHGGLGNQLFQIYYALCQCNGSCDKVYIYHSANYYHKTKLNPAFKSLKVYKLSSAPFLLRLRLIKILSKLGRKSEQIKFNRNLYLDGYFQNKEIYSKLSSKNKENALKFLRDLLGLKYNDKTKINQTLLHIRLGDFFVSNEKKEEKLLEILKSGYTFQKILTNEESLVKEFLKRKSKLEKNTIIPSSTKKPEELLKLMSQFDTIISNGSTLATWAALLGNSKLVSTSEQTELIKFLMEK